MIQFYFDSILLTKKNSAVNSTAEPICFLDSTFLSRLTSASFCGETQTSLTSVIIVGSKANVSVFSCKVLLKHVTLQNFFYITIA